MQNPKVYTIIFGNCKYNISAIFHSSKSWAYRLNLEKIMEAAQERGYGLDPNWSYLVLGILFYGVHLYFTLSVLF